MTKRVEPGVLKKGEEKKFLESPKRSTRRTSVESGCSVAQHLARVFGF